jgi:hypothetical protein
VALLYGIYNLSATFLLVRLDASAFLCHNDGWLKNIHKGKEMKHLYLIILAFVVVSSAQAQSTKPKLTQQRVWEKVDEYRFQVPYANWTVIAEVTSSPIWYMAMRPCTDYEKARNPEAKWAVLIWPQGKGSGAHYNCKGKADLQSNFPRDFNNLIPDLPSKLKKPPAAGL